MKIDELFKIVKKLPFDKEFTVLKREKCRLFILRPSEPPKRFKQYDPTKNFQIWLEDPENRFKPNHLRVLIDLNLRVRSNPDRRKELMIAFDNIFYGEDPNIALNRLYKISFGLYLNTLPIIGHLSQLFIIEQEYSYTSSKESKYDPPSLFYQGWVRQFLDGPREIDIMCMSASRGQPPKVQYTKKENKNHSEYTENLPELWYLGMDKKLNSFID